MKTYLQAMSDPEVELDEVEAVLKRVQHFDPIGVAARTPSECLSHSTKTFVAGYAVARRSHYARRKLYGNVGVT